MTDYRNALPPGFELDRGRYVITDVLGAGGFGIVYRVTDRRRKIDRAIKEFLPSAVALREGTHVHPLNSQVAETYAYSLKSFQEEARKLRFFAGHRNVAQCTDYFEAHGTGYLVMAYQDGLPLTELLARREALGNPLREWEIIGILIPLLEGLAAVHAEDMLHRDISKLIGELLVPKLAYDDPEQDRPWDLNVKPGEEFILKIAQGESIKAISERYIYDGDLYLQADNAGKLQKVEFRFTRTNPLGYRYKEERRDLVNPSPNFTPEENPDTVDRNDDITLTYYEMKDEQTEFKKISEFTLKDIQYFDKQMMIIDAYKKYLRRARKRLEQSVYDRKLREKIRVRHMLSFE